MRSLFSFLAKVGRFSFRPCGGWGFKKNFWRLANFLSWISFQSSAHHLEEPWWARLLPRLHHQEVPVPISQILTLLRQVSMPWEFCALSWQLALPLSDSTPSSILSRLMDGKTVGSTYIPLLCVFTEKHSYINWSVLLTGKADTMFIAWVKNIPISNLFASLPWNWTSALSPTPARANRYFTSFTFYQGGFVAYISLCHTNIIRYGAGTHQWDVPVTKIPDFAKVSECLVYCIVQHKGKDGPIYIVHF